jgi:hypothetical protein
LSRAVGLAVGLVKHRPDDLTPSRWVGAAVTVPLNHDRGPVIGLDDGAEVWPERAGRALALGEIRSAESPRDRAFTASVGNEEQLLPAAIEGDAPALRIGEPDA